MMGRTKQRKNIAPPGAKTHNRYLLGLGANFTLLVIRLSTDDDGGNEKGTPEAYAVLNAADVAWNGFAEEDASFGAAYFFQDQVDVFFAADSGAMFRLGLPVEVPDECWNTGAGPASCSTRAGGEPSLSGDDVAGHVACDDPKFDERVRAYVASFVARAREK